MIMGQHMIQNRNRIEINIKEIKRVPGSSSEDEEAAVTVEFLDLNRLTCTFE